MTSKVGALAAFTKKKMTCIGCKVPLAVETDAVCPHCKPKHVFFAFIPGPAN